MRLFFSTSARRTKNAQRLLELARRTAERLFIPLTIGGGIRTVDDMAAALRAGADKIGVNSAAVSRPAVITEGARKFGAQCIVASIDARRDGDTWRVYTSGARVRTELDAVEWARECAALGAGEILLTSIDRDGARTGYDLELTRAVSEAVNVPVIASGGAGTAVHVCDVLERAGADAALVAGIVHDGITTVYDTQARDARGEHSGEDGRMKSGESQESLHAGRARMCRYRRLVRASALSRRRRGRVETRRLAGDARRPRRRASSRANGSKRGFRTTASSAKNSARNRARAAVAGLSIRSTGPSRSCAACRCGGRSSRCSKMSIVLAGAASFPATGETIAAAKGCGCWHNASRAGVSGVAAIAEATVLTSDDRIFESGARRNGWDRLAGMSAVSRMWGDAFGYLLVATGRADVMVDAVVNAWDIACFVPIIEEAGGAFTDYTGRVTAFGGTLDRIKRRACG